MRRLLYMSMLFLVELVAPCCTPDNCVSRIGLHVEWRLFVAFDASDSTKRLKV